MGQTRTPAEAGSHEEFLRLVRSAVIGRAVGAGRVSEEEAEKLMHTKLVYGVGDGRYRGVCHYGAWENGIGNVDVIEVAASGEESWVQLAGTTMHELGHVLAGWGAGHSEDWKAAAERLGLRRAMAAGQVYQTAQFDPMIRVEAARLAQQIADGNPAFFSASRLVALGRPATTGVGRGYKPRPCTAGYGTKGGTSRGTGSGSRMVKCECFAPDCGYQVRTTAKWIAVGAPWCGRNQKHGRLIPEQKPEA